MRSDREGEVSVNGKRKGFRRILTVTSGNSYSFIECIKYEAVSWVRECAVREKCHNIYKRCFQEGLLDKYRMIIAR